MKDHDVFAHRTACDLTIVGAGPTGLFAAYYAGFRGLTVTVVDAQPDAGGQVAALYPAKTIHDVAGFPGVTGADLIKGLRAQAEVYEPRMVFGQNVVDIVRDEREAGLSVSLEDGSSIDTRAIVLATGVGGIRPRILPLGHGWHGRGRHLRGARPRRRTSARTSSSSAAGTPPSTGRSSSPPSRAR